MTTPSNFDDQLADWFEDGPTDAPDQVLDGVLAAFPAIRQRRGVFGLAWTTASFGFASALAGLAVAVGLGAVVLFAVWRPGPGDVGGPGLQSPGAVASATATAPPASTASPASTATASAAASPVSTPSAPPAIGACDPAHLAARITLWEGAAGQRTAHIELTNDASVPCTVRALARPQLVDGNGSVLIDGAAPAASKALTVEPGATLKTLVQDGNYCGPNPSAPVSVAFVLSDGGRVVATPLSAKDATVPPCLGAGLPADIGMQPWSR